VIAGKTANRALPCFDRMDLYRGATGLILGGFFGARRSTPGAGFLLTSVFMDA